MAGIDPRDDRDDEYCRHRFLCAMEGLTDLVEASDDPEGDKIGAIMSILTEEAKRVLAWKQPKFIKGVNDG